jgi:glycine dehydrogenase subunit 1
MRYLPLTEADRKAMLGKIGVADIDALFADIPKEKRLEGLVDLPKAKGELEVERALGKMAARNTAAGSVPFFVGAGAYKHHVPASVDHLIQRSEFLTSYTPYQPEIAQGTLQYLFEFQSQVAMLTGMEVANASMYDGSTAAAEAVLMAHRVTKRRRAVLAGNLHPHYRETIETVSRLSEHELTVLPAAPGGKEKLAEAIDETVSCVVVQTPDFYGHLHDLTDIAEAAHAAGALLVAVFTEAVSLGLVQPPGAMGADIVVGEGQSIGNALTFGGPYVGLFATRSKLIRQMPGRLAGETVDREGRRGFVLTLSTREQHIRREKATSNICTNSGLCVLAFTIHLSLLGEAGLRRLARINHANAVALAKALGKVEGVTVLNDTFFNEFTIRVPGNAAEVIEKLAAKGVLGGVPVSRLEPGRPELADLIVVASTEINTDEDRAAYAAALKEALA